jgi:transposase
VVKELKLDWQTVKALDKQYIGELLKRAEMPGPKATGIDEISIHKGDTCRIVISVLGRKPPIWFGVADRSEASMGMSYAALRASKSVGI